MSIIEEEKAYLKYVLERINIEIEKSNKELKELCKAGTSLSFEDRKRGEHFNINSRADNVSKRIGILTRAIPTPYFGRMDLSLNDTGEYVKKIYIGKSGIISDSQSLVTDWRAPISSLYYDSELGNVKYESPQGTIYGNLRLKRQINIKNSELIDAQDTSLVTNDDLLKPYLSTNADNKMKIIIASIQKEQNEIIRKSPQNNIIVQGVAGSGKTSVALHRIAYLIYELGSRISTDQFLVLGPNEYFLNYVSSILPDLETSPVSQKTFFNFAKEYINEKISLKPDEEINKKTENTDSYRRIQKFKSSLQFKELLDIFMNNYLNEYVVEKDFVIDGEVIFSKDTIKRYLFMLDSEIPNYNKAFQMLSYNLKTNIYEIYDKINQKYKEIYTKLPFDNKERNEIVKKSTDLYNTLKNDGNKLLKKYISEIKKSPIDIYKMFICSLDNDYLPLSEKEFLLLQKETLLDLKKKKIGFEDIPALIHINYRYARKELDYRYLIIDEAQDYGMFHFTVLQEINPNSNFAIYGDLAQSIYSYRSINSWEEVNDKVFNNKCELLKLNKSYRTTIEITDNANMVLTNIGLNQAEPVIRHGVSVEYEEKANDLEYKVSKIRELQSKGYETIAIICKTEKEAEKLNKTLLKCDVDSKYISSKDVEYAGGLFVLTSASSKGLEFDAVIINDASSTVYSDTSDVDMHLLYVASTRALHELAILYDHKIVSVYQDAVKKNNSSVPTKILRKK